MNWELSVQRSDPMGYSLKSLWHAIIKTPVDNRNVSKFTNLGGSGPALAGSVSGETLFSESWMAIGEGLLALQGPLLKTQVPLMRSLLTGSMFFSKSFT